MCSFISLSTCFCFSISFSCSSFCFSSSLSRMSALASFLTKSCSFLANTFFTASSRALSFSVEEGCTILLSTEATAGEAAPALLPSSSSGGGSGSTGWTFCSFLGGRVGRRGGALAAALVAGWLTSMTSGGWSGIKGGGALKMSLSAAAAAATCLFFMSASLRET